MSKSRSLGLNGGGTSSKSSSSSTSTEEPHMKTLKELSHNVQGNRYCFECGQRGPTYVDVTVGSFVCTTCSGLLRGLTPPHRVKSISMASFTADEVGVLKSRGNEYCRKVWLATYTGKDDHVSGGSGISSAEQDADRRTALKSHLSAKYEQKRFWIDPSKIPGEELAGIQADTLKALTSSGGVSSSTSSSINRSPSLSSASSGSSLGNFQQPQPNHQASPVMNNLRTGGGGQKDIRLPSSQTLPDMKPLSSLFQSSSIAPISFINNLSSNSSSWASASPKSDDKIINTNPSLLSLNSKDPWTNGESTSGNGFTGNFANFEEAFSGLSLQQQTSSGNGNSDPFFASSTTTLVAGPAPATNYTNGGDSNFAYFDKPLMLPTSHFHNKMSNGEERGGGGSATNPNINNFGGDRYAALKDLDELFKTGEPTTNGPMSSSKSVPVNLSSSSAVSASAAAVDGGGGGWFSSSPNYSSVFGTPSSNNTSTHITPNPFADFGTTPPHKVTVGGGGGMMDNGWTNPSGQNPFFGPAPSSGGSWSSSPAGGPFGGGGGATSHLFSNQSSYQTNNNSNMFSSTNGSVFNPFTTPSSSSSSGGFHQSQTATTTGTGLGSSNPHNPFI